MKRLSCELAGIGWNVGLPMMTVGNDEPRIKPRRAFAFDADAPALRGVLRPCHALIEADQGIELKLFGIGTEIVLRLNPAQIMRPLLRNLEIGVARELLRRVEERRAVDDVRVFGIPDAADIGQRLEAIEGDATLGKGLGDRQAAGPCADDTITLHHPSPCRPAKPAWARPKHPMMAGSTHPGPFPSLLHLCQIAAGAGTNPGAPCGGGGSPLFADALL